MQSGGSNPSSSPDMSKIKYAIAGDNRLHVYFTDESQTTVIRHIPHRNLPSPTLSSRTCVSPTRKMLKRETTHSTLAMSRTRIGDPIPDQGCGAAQ